MSTWQVQWHIESCPFTLYPDIEMLCVIAQNYHEGASSISINAAASCNADADAWKDAMLHFNLFSKNWLQASVKLINRD